MTELAPSPAQGTAVDITCAASHEDARAVAEVLGAIWTQERMLPLAPELVWALAHAGNYVALARRDGAVIGAAVGFRGEDEDGPHLHSHIAGVLPDHQGGNVGFLLKQHQRDWSLARGIGRVTWTFDPLVARNAYFNVVKLGAEIVRYYDNFYGPLGDDINAGDESDRCLVNWELNSDRAGTASAGSVLAVSSADLRASGAVDVLVVGDGGEPVAVESVGSGTQRLCALPADIVAFRRTHAELARAWRRAVRGVLGPALRGGSVVTTVTRDGALVLTPPGA